MKNLDNQKTVSKSLEGEWDWQREMGGVVPLLSLFREFVAKKMVRARTMLLGVFLTLIPVFITWRTNINVLH